MDGKHGRTTSVVKCHHHLWAAHTIERRRAWHAIIALMQYTRSNNVGNDMPSPSLESTHGGTTSGVACHHRLWAAQTVERRWAWLAIIAFGLADTVGRRQAWHAIITLDGKHGRTTSGVACHHRPWKTHTVGNVGRGMTSPHLDSSYTQQRRAWHADIIALEQHTLLATSGVAWHHRPWTAHTIGNVGHGMTSPPLENTHGRTTSGVACHHRLWAAHTV